MSAQEKLASSSFDVIVVDRMLPDGEGLDLIRGLRGDGVLTPALCLSGLDSVDARVEGLTSGVDDYLVKPFAVRELLARVELMVHRHEGAGLEVLETGPLRIEIPSRQVYFKGVRVILTARELDLLEVFARNPGKVMSRAQLWERVWGGGGRGVNVVDVYIGYLRAKLDRSIIQTIRGVGYCLDSD